MIKLNMTPKNAPGRARVLALAKEGHGKPFIAKKLGITIVTVHYHFKRARKYGELPALEKKP